MRRSNPIGKRTVNRWYVPFLIMNLSSQNNYDIWIFIFSSLIHVGREKQDYIWLSLLILREWLLFYRMCNTNPPYSLYTPHSLCPVFSPCFRWKDPHGLALPIAGRVHTSDGVLSISDAGQSDSGRYSCIAHNMAGTRNTTAWIVVSSEYWVERIDLK